jgi:hypothetical protein
MGNDPGKVLNTPTDKSRIVIDITGPFKGEDSEDFKRQLTALLDKFKAKWGKCDLPRKS